ncbi:MAG: TlpA family protein disulfide reductase [Candidatus Spechtbacterales bacterium]|nr:TlpA family protein disulfide reductase [Candidatus Spechtbacterales bacterium]
MRKLLGVFAVLVMVLSACSSGNTEDPNVDSSPSETVTEGPVEGLSVGDIAPDIELTTLEGDTVHLSDYRGKVVFLNFWTTWCPYCHKEMPSMQRMYEKYGEDGFIILALDIAEDAETVRRYMEENNLTFPAFLYHGSLTSHPMNKTSGTPQTYIIDRDGIIVDYVSGYRDWDVLGNQASIKRALQDR